MKVKYECRDCGDYIGEIRLDEIDEEKLGFNILNSEERAEMVQFNQKLDIIRVKAICDDCWAKNNSSEFVEFGNSSFVTSFLH